MRLGDELHIRSNSKLYKLLNDKDVGQRMEEHAPPRQGYLLRKSAVAGEEDDVECFRKTKSRKYCHRLV